MASSQETHLCLFLVASSFVLGQILSCLLSSVVISEVGAVVFALLMNCVTLQALYFDDKFGTLRNILKFENSGSYQEYAQGFLVNTIHSKTW